MPAVVLDLLAFPNLIPLESTVCLPNVSNLWYEMCEPTAIADVVPNLPPALAVGAKRFENVFSSLDLYNSSPEFGDLWYRSEESKKTF